MNKCRILIYDCYVPLNDEVKEIHLDKIEEMEKELLENPENKIVGKFFDKCSSTIPLKDRPEFQKVLSQASADQIDMIVSINMKSFSRNLNDLLPAIFVLDNIGIVVKTHDGEFDSSSMQTIKNLKLSRSLDVSEFLDDEREQDAGMTMQ